MIYIILGMHKSGTTLVSEMLHVSGINMGVFDERLGYDQNNKFERHETQALNRQFLNGLLIPPLGYLLRRPFRSTYDQAGYRRNKDSIAIIRRRALHRRLADGRPPDGLRPLIDRLSTSFDDWGFKDPRTCLTYPLWRRYLPEHKIIIVYRHYNQLLRRYRVGHWHLARLFRVLHGWTVYNQANLESWRAPAVPALIVGYEDLMTGDEAFDRLCTFVGRPLKDVRRPELYRHRAGSGQELPPLSSLVIPFLPASPSALYDELERLQRAPIAETDLRPAVTGEK